MAIDNVKTEILLESGTNEFEIMEFSIAGEIFGINVAKVRELMKYSPVKPMPNCHANVEGIFKPRDIVLTVIDLAAYMGLPPSEDVSRDLFIITNFNKKDTAFHVHEVEGIHRVSWNDIEKPDDTIYGGQEGMATGIAKVKDKLITIIDFEKLLFDISPESGIQMSEIEALGVRERNEKPILMADDSPLLNRMIFEALHGAGYLNVRSFPNGQEVWEWLLEVDADIQGGKATLESRACCLITDIEMPKMDGHRLTKLIKDHRTLKRLPVIFFSSLINDEMRDKGDELGASAQLSKPEIGNLVSTVDKWIL